MARANISRRYVASKTFKEIGAKYRVDSDSSRDTRLLLSEVAVRATTHQEPIQRSLEWQTCCWVQTGEASSNGSFFVFVFGLWI